MGQSQSPRWLLLHQTWAATVAIHSTWDWCLLLQCRCHQWLGLCARCLLCLVYHITPFLCVTCAWLHSLTGEFSPNKPGIVEIHEYVYFFQGCSLVHDSWAPVFSPSSVINDLSKASSLAPSVLIHKMVALFSTINAMPSSSKDLSRATVQYILIHILAWYYGVYGLIGNTYLSIIIVAIQKMTKHGWSYPWLCSELYIIFSGKLNKAEV